MAADKYEIWNQALRHIGNKTQLTATSTGKEFRLCDNSYETLRKRYLEQFNWTFANKRVTLTNTGTEPPGEQYAYAYAWLADMLNPVSIIQGSTAIGIETIPFKNATNASTGLREMWMNYEDPVLEYTFDQDVTTNYPAAFDAALAWGIAAEIAIPLTTSQGSTQDFANEATMALHRAIRIDRAFQQPELKKQGRLTTVRRGSGYVDIPYEPAP